MSRPDGRSADQLREIKMTRGWLAHAEGSVLVEFGQPRVLCAARATEDVPRWRRGCGEEGAAETEMSVVCPAGGGFVEIQGTAEREPFSRALLDELLDLGVAGCAELTKLQQQALGR